MSNTPTTVLMSRNSANLSKRIDDDEAELLALEEENRKNSAPVVEAEAPEDTTDNAEERTFKKRYADLRRHSQQEKETLQKELDAIKAEALTRSDDALPTNKAAVEEWIKKYPDVASIVQTLSGQTADSRIKAQTDTISKRLADIEERDRSVTRRDVESAIRKSHSDYDDLKASDAFHDWAESQSKFIQDALYENESDSSAIIRVIDLYKSDTSKDTPTPKGKDTSAADAINTRTQTKVDVNSSNGKIRESDVAKMTDKEYAKNEDAIMEALKTGNFIYDMSKK
jgi:hypothetical protein